MPPDTTKSRSKRDCVSYIPITPVGHQAIDAVANKYYKLNTVYDVKKDASELE